LGKLLKEVGDELNRAARQLAWLQTAPVPESADLAQRQAAVSRREKMEADGEVVLLPECSAGFLLTTVLEIGPVRSTGMAPAPFGWSDLVDFQRCTAVELQPWEARALVAMSREYAAFMHKAEKPDCPAPWGDDVTTEQRRQRVAQDLRRAFAGLMTSKPRPSKITKRKK
jgi:hypothetical protein